MSILEVQNELAHDLVREHLDTLLMLIEKPLPEADVVARLGSKRVLERMVRHGLLVQEAGTLKAVAAVYHQLRQESMMDFLEHYILPALGTGNGFSTLQTAYLTLNPTDAAMMRPGRTAKLFEALSLASDTPCSGMGQRLTVMVIGTTRVATEPLDTEAQALVHVKQAALQRATPAERPLAMLAQFVCLADSARYQAANRLVTDFLNTLDKERASSPVEATYHLTVASHWQCAAPVPSDGIGQ